MRIFYFFFFSSRRRHTRLVSDWSSDVCSSDLIDARAVDVPTDGTPGASFQGKDTGGTSRLVVDRASATIVGATFTGFETADFLHAATVAIVAEVPMPRLRHAIPAYPSRSEIWLKLVEAYEKE